MTDASTRLIEALLEQLYQQRREPHYRATLRELRLRLDAENNRLYHEEPTGGYAGQPTMRGNGRAV